MARVDHLFERIALRMPKFEKDMQGLMREHAKGLLCDTQIAKYLADSSLRVLEGAYGQQLAKQRLLRKPLCRSHMAGPHRWLAEKFA